MTTPAFNSFVPGSSTQDWRPDNLIITVKNTDNEAVLKQRDLTPYKRGMVLGQVTATALYTEALAASNDGSQVPNAILLDDVDATAGDTKGPVCIAGEFNSRALLLGTGITAAAAKAALRKVSIYVKGSVSAADPT